MRRTAAAFVACLVLTACSDVSSEHADTLPSSQGGLPAPCRPHVTQAPLPTWARAGFSPPDQVVRYAEGSNGDILGVLFGFPMKAPSGPDRQNKILWVARVGIGTLRIHATSADGSRHVVRTVPGAPGPSIIDMPAPGCWHFELRWAGHDDEVDVDYRA